MTPWRPRGAGPTGRLAALVALASLTLLSDPAACAAGEVRVEFRWTDVFDEPPLPELGPPADWFGEVSAELAHGSARLRVGAESLRSASSARGRAFAQYARPLGARVVRAGAAGLWDGEGSAGGSGWLDVSWSPKANLDLAGRAELSRSLAGTAGLRLECRAEMLFSPKTFLRLRGWCFADQEGSGAGAADAALGHALSPRTALEVRSRGYLTSAEDSNVHALAFSHGVTDRLILRAGYRWYADSLDRDARGPTFGVAVRGGRVSGEALYRRYVTGAGLTASTWALACVTRF